MDKLEVFPDKPIPGGRIVSEKFLSLGIKNFLDACRYVHELPYGYNSDRDDLMILFKENKGNCTTKHAVIATLAEELNLPIAKYVGIYAMNEEIVTGTNEILDKYHIPFVPMIHCFLVYREYKVDLSEGNDNGKNRSIEDFLFTRKVDPNISAKDEYLLYRKALAVHILTRKELAGVNLRQILHAREMGLELLERNIGHP
jgi:hypothetical protein